MAAQLESNNPIQKKRLTDSLWRYMDLWSLISVILNESLYFCRADKFPDELEGTWPSADADRFQQTLQKDMSITDFPENVRKKTIEIFKEARETERKRTFINCWHLNSYQNMAMWAAYAPHGKGIAVKTTLARLKNVLPNYIVIACCNYKDYVTQSLFDDKHKRITPFIYKAVEYEFENEVRCIVTLPPKGMLHSEFPKIKKGIGCHVPIDSIKNLIERIYLSPRSEPWIEANLRKLFNRIGLDIPVEQSHIKIKSK